MDNKCLYKVHSVIWDKNKFLRNNLNNLWILRTKKSILCQDNQGQEHYPSLRYIKFSTLHKFKEDNFLNRNSMEHNCLAHNNNAIHSQGINKVRLVNQDNKSPSVRFISLLKIQKLDQVNPNKASLPEIYKDSSDQCLRS